MSNYYNIAGEEMSSGPPAFDLTEETKTVVVQPKKTVAGTRFHFRMSQESMLFVDGEQRIVMDATVTNPLRLAAERAAAERAVAERAAAERAAAEKNAAEAQQHQQRWASSLRISLVLTNSIGMKLCLISAGEFMMGSPADEKGRRSDEGPVHQVRIAKPFYLGVYEVTQGEYEQIMGKNPSEFQGSTLPVKQVSWEDAVKFCQKLSAKEGQGYRLPTEAEWEYACRAGTTTPFSFGSALNGQEANVDGRNPYGTETKGPYKEETVPVGSYRANGFGLYDMHGNVWEWCADWYDAEYYGKSPSEDPPGAASGSFRVFRGGCWVSSAGFCRAADCGWFGPSFRIICLGFRLVRTVSLASPSR